MSDEAKTVFRLTAGDVNLELSGTGVFVGRQVQHLRALLEAVILGSDGKGAASNGAGRAAQDSDETESLDHFYKARPTRDGRGAIQDRILLFIYYLQHVQGKRAICKDDISWCFNRVGLATPKNLLNALGNMRRKLGYLQSGDRRGLYRLAPKGRQYVEERFKPV